LRRLALVGLAVVAALVLGEGASSTATAVSGSWVGTYTLGGSGDVAFTVRGRRATVTLGVGHAGIQVVAASTAGGLRFTLPGRPAPVVFHAVLKGSALVGTVSQGRARGAFRATRGTAPELTARGIYAGGGKTVAVVDDPYGPARLVDLDTGEVRALTPADGALRIGSGFASERPSRGVARFDLAAARLPDANLALVRLRELEVRFPRAGAMLSATLTLPPGAGPHPAVAWVTGSGPTTRAYLPDLTALLVHHGVAVLAYDKRGIGQSGGRYPGESPTRGTIDVLARDAAAAVRFLAAQPEIDRSRVGLAGHSQAGWIMPLAATREPKVRFVLAFAGPAVTADENDIYQTLAGEGDTPQHLSDEQVDAQVLAQGPSGVDPMPWVRSLRVPAAWFFGGLDKIMPTRLSVKLLEPVAKEQGRDFTISVLPRANHALVETTTGLTSEMLVSSTFAPGLFRQVGEWLRARGFGT
jgi:dienelactone hydrolase